MSARLARLESEKERQFLYAVNPVFRVEGTDLDVIQARKAGILGNEKAVSTTFCIPA
jgi:hypothetical protein